MLKVKAITNLGVRELELSQNTVATLNKQMDDHPEGIPYIDEEGHQLKILGVAVVTRALVGKRIRVGNFE